MFGTINLSTFIISGIALNLYPGPDTMYIISRSLSQGRRAGIMSVFGISSGGLCHTLLAGLGLSSLLVALPGIFRIIKIAGALYLVYLGMRFLLNRKSGAGISETYLSNLTNFQIYKQGLLTNLFNPKVALFFLSFLPQFIDPVNNMGFISFIFLGLIFFTTGTIWCLAVAVFSAKISDIIKRNQKYVIYMERITGIVLIGLGVNLFV